MCLTSFRFGLFLLIIGFILGIGLASLFDWGWVLIGLCLVLSLAFSGLFFIYNRLKLFVILVIILGGLIGGLFRFDFSRDFRDQSNSDCLPNCLGMIISDIDRRDNTTRLTVELARSEPVRSRVSRSQIRLRASDEPVNQLLRKTTWLHEVAFLKSSPTKILIITDNFTDYQYGDQIEITGKLEKPKNFLTDQNKVFDYKNYLLVRGIERLSYYPKIKISSRNQGSIIKASLFKVKNSFLNNLQQVLPEPAATLAGGIILGDKGGLGKKVEDEFRQAGLSHIIVLSGYNITIVAESVLKFFAWLSPAWSWLFGLGSIFLFVLMTGGEAAAVRAAVMGAIALIARRYGRTYDAGVALVFAGFLMILWNPRLLVFDLGFQLSFLATLGLIYISPIVSRLIEKVSFLRKTTSSSPEVAFLKSSPTFRTGILSGLKELISTTTGAQLAVYPWLLYRVGNASLVGFISNIFILPIVPLAMFASFTTGLSGFISPLLSLFFSYPTYFLLKYILQGAYLFSTFSNLWIT